jgi:hypothetical protein
LSVIATIAFASGTSYAQEPVPPPPSEAPPAVAPTPPPATEPTPPPPPPPPVAAPPVAVAAPGGTIERSDLDVEARRWAIGYLGLSQVPVGSTPEGVDITVPSIGIRYWTSPTLAFELGFGIGWAGGSTETGGVTMDKDKLWGFIVQGGLPIALSTHRHVSFQLIPYTAIAHGQTSTLISNGIGGTTPADYSGLRFDVGARAGLELFFGFIGIPELALSATIGMRFVLKKYTVDTGGLTSSDTSYDFSTTVQNNPWDIFAGNVAARYYF